MATITEEIIPGGWVNANCSIRFNTTIAEQANGFDESQINWPVALLNIRVSYLRSAYESIPGLRFDDLYAFFCNCRGMGYGFLVDDVIDNTDATCNGAGIIELVNGVYRLTKSYSAGSYRRYITRPKGDVVVSAGTLDFDTGIVTGISSAGTWTGSFQTPMRFASDDLSYGLLPDGTINVIEVPLREEREV